jgi:hypothetical protein
MADIIFFQEILTAEGKKMRAVADYWARMKKGKRTLDSWDLTYLECEIFSWSLEDVLNKNLLKEKVGISHPLHQTRHSILLTNSFCDNKVDKHENAYHHTCAEVYLHAKRCMAINKIIAIFCYFSVQDKSY